MFRSFPDGYTEPFKLNGQLLPLYKSKAEAVAVLHAKPEIFDGKEVELRTVYVYEDVAKAKPLDNVPTTHPNGVPIDEEETETQEDLATRAQNEPAAQAGD